MIRLPPLDGVNGNLHGLTQARQLEEIEQEAVDYICTVAAVAPSSSRRAFWSAKRCASAPASRSALPSEPRC